MTHRCVLWICMSLMAGCVDQLGAEQLGVATSAIVPDDESKLACPSGPHEIAGRGYHDWGRADVDFGPYDDAPTAEREATKECKTKTDDAMKRTENAAISECKEDIDRVVCGLGPEDRPCDLKPTPIKTCEVTDRWGATGETKPPKKIGEKYYVNCSYKPVARARGKIKASCELRR
jgi:hypothetical protein